VSRGEFAVQVLMERTRVRRPEGSATISSPGECACGDLSREAAKILMRTQHALHGKTETGIQSLDSERTVSSNSSRLGPLYQGMRWLR